MGNLFQSFLVFLFGGNFFTSQRGRCLRWEMEQYDQAFPDEVQHRQDAAQSSLNTTSMSNPQIRHTMTLFSTLSRTFWSRAARVKCRAKLPLHSSDACFKPGPDHLLPQPLPTLSRPYTRLPICVVVGSPLAEGSAH